MKHVMEIIAGIILFVILTHIFISSSFGQQAWERAKRTPNPDVYQEYIYHLNAFYNDRKLFENDRTKYLAYKTLTAEENVLRSSKFLLDSSRATLKAYVIFLKKTLSEQPDINTRVKQAILDDIEKHITYLNDVEPTIEKMNKLNETVELSKGLQLRYNYISVTTNQALAYIDIIETKSLNDKLKEIVSDFQSLIAGYPQTNENKQIIDKWIEQTMPELTQNEMKLNTMLDNIYPVEINNQTPIYEKGHHTQSNVGAINAQLRKYTHKLKEIYQIAKEAYREL